MKKTFVFILIFFTAVVFSGDNISEFILKDFNFSSLEILKNTSSGIKINCIVDKYNMTDIYEMREKYRSDILNEYFKKNDKITARQLLKFFKADQRYVIQKDYSQPITDYSYKKAYKGKTPIGESGFISGKDPYMGFAGNVEYWLLYLDGNEIVRLRLKSGYLFEEMDVLESLPEIFYKKDGKWYWKSEDAMVELCRMMENHDERLPVEMLELQLKWEEIIGNLEVDGKKITLK